MNTQSNFQAQKSVWKHENAITNLRLRVKTFYNADYFERIILPLLDLPRAGHAKGWLTCAWENGIC
jgi:hypothetical protein